METEVQRISRVTGQFLEIISNEIETGISPTEVVACLVSVLGFTFSKMAGMTLTDTLRDSVWKGICAAYEESRK